MNFFSKSADPADSFESPTAVLDNISGEYVIDASHTRIGFSTRHAMVTTVRGSFPEFEGTAIIDTVSPDASRVALTIAAASFTTGSPDRDGHVKSADFFDVEQFPTITFISTKVERDGDEWTITGDLTIKGVSNPVTLVFEQLGSARDPFGNVRVGFEGGATINRTDWGLTYNAALETGGVLISDKVKLDFDISAIQAA